MPDVLLDKNYAIRDLEHDPYLIHRCNAEECHFTHDTGSRQCIGCHKRVPDKIIFMYKLWKFHNG